MRENGEEDPRAKFRSVSPGFFAALGVPLLAGRDFSDHDSGGTEKVVIITQSLAQRFFPNQNAVNGQLAVDRQRDEVHRRQPGTPPHRRHRRGSGR